MTNVTLAQSYVLKAGKRLRALEVLLAEAAYSDVGTASPPRSRPAFPTWREDRPGCGGSANSRSMGTWT